jgi:hypothetical protein
MSDYRRIYRPRLDHCLCFKVGTEIYFSRARLFAIPQDLIDQLIYFFAVSWFLTRFLLAFQFRKHELMVGAITSEVMRGAGKGLLALFVRVQFANALILLVKALPFERR